MQPWKCWMPESWFRWWWSHSMFSVLWWQLLLKRVSQRCQGKPCHYCTCEHDAACWLRRYHPCIALGCHILVIQLQTGHWWWTRFSALSGKLTNQQWGSNSNQNLLLYLYFQLQISVSVLERNHKTDYLWWTYFSKLPLVVSTVCCDTDRMCALNLL